MEDSLERALVESEERYRSVVTAMAEGVVLQDQDAVILACNAAAERLLGLTADQMMGRTSLDPRWRAIHEDGSPFPGETHPVPVTLRTGVAQRDVIMGVHKPDGSLTWISINTQPLFRAGAERPYAAVCTFTDITARKATESALVQSEDRYRRIIDTTREGVWTMDPEGRTTFANARMAEVLGCSLAELSAASVWDFVDASERPQVAEALAGRATTVREPIELRFRDRRGGLVWTSASITPMVHADGRGGALAMVRDVSERRRIELQLRESQEVLTMALAAGRMWTWTLDVASQILSWFGSDTDAFSLPHGAPTTLDDFAGQVHPDDREAVMSRFAGYVEALSRGTSQPGERFQAEFRLVGRDGGVRWASVVGRGVVDPATRAPRLVGTLVDITERHELEEQLLQARKLEAVGRLAGGVAHDFNNLLTALLTSVTFAERKATAEIKQDLDIIRTAAERAADITRQLLAFARKQVVQLRQVALGSLIGELEAMLRRLLGEAIELRCQLAADLWTVRADPTQLEQLLVNLLANARDALARGGLVTIEARNARVAGAHGPLEPDVPPGDYVVVTVSDTGAGIDEETMRHIFEPFFTTKRAGTGLGLASCYGTVKQLGGHIFVSSQPGTGSKFEIYLPRETGGAAPAAPPTRPPVAAAGALETILVVEDDALLRGVVIRGLTELSYRVLAAADGEEALELARGHRGAIHVAVIDVVMPKISGDRLAELLVDIHPDIKVLLVSGYADQMIAHQDSAGPDAGFLAKPYSIDTLVQRIRALRG